MDDLDDLQLIHRLETMFTGSLNWETAQLQLTTAQVLELTETKYPNLFTASNLAGLFEKMHIKPMFNEHNWKWYWLLDWVV